MEASAHPEWPARLVEFNLHVARIADRSWYPKLLKGIPDSTAPTAFDERRERHLSKCLLQMLGLEHIMDWTMREPQKRLFLLDRPSLTKLAYELSVAMHREWLARVIDGSRLRGLRARIETQAWRFAVEGVPDGMFRHRSPTVDFESGAPEELTATLQRDGARVLLALMQPAWLAASQRARLRFDREAGVGVAAFGAERQEKALELICDHLIPKRLPRWAWLF